MAVRDLDLVTLGEALLGLWPDDGAPIGSATRLSFGVVGAESNAALAVSRLGHRVAFLGRVGTDAAGRRIIRTLRSEGVDVGGLREDPDASTGILIRDAGGPRGTSVDYHRTGSAGSRLAPSDVDTGVIGRSRFLLITGLTCGLSDSAAEAVASAVASARAQGTVVCLDPNLRSRIASDEEWRERVGPLLASVDVIIGSAAELTVVTGTTSREDALSELTSSGVETVVMRSDDAPTVVVTAGYRFERTFERVSPVDAVGAGDAFAGGFLSGLIDGIDIEAAVERAQAVARRCVMTMGDVEGLPTRQELTAVLGEVHR